MAESDFPNDDWHSYVYMFLSVDCCGGCHFVPDLAWAWKLLSEGESGAEKATILVVAHLRREGWMMHDNGPVCPACAKKLGLAEGAT